MGNSRSMLKIETNNMIRGVLMLMIMFSHSEQALLRFYGDSLFGNGALPFGRLGASMFLFLSGYGMFISLSKKQQLVWSYILKKIYKIIATWIYAFLITLVICIAIDADYNIIDSILTLDLPNRGEWFIKVLLLCYILSFIVFKLFRTANDLTKIFIIAFGIGIYMIVAERMEVLMHYYSTSLCYPFGMLFSYNRHKLSSVKPQLGAMITTFCGLFCVIFIYVLHIKGVRFYIPFMFCVFVSFLSCILTKKENIIYKSLEYIGCNSLIYYWVHIGLNGFDVGNKYSNFIFLIIATTFLTYLYALIKSNLSRLKWGANV